MRPKKITQEQLIQIELHFETLERYQFFIEAYVKLSERAGYAIGELSKNREALTIDFKGRMDTLNTIWFVMGAFTERSYLTKTVIKPN